MAATRKPKSKPAAELDSRGLSAVQLSESGEKDKSKSKKDADKVKNWVEDADVLEEATKMVRKIVKCYDNKYDYNDNCTQYWSIYNCETDDNARYEGNNDCYIPAVRDALNARTKRALAQLFPVNHKHVDAVGPTGDTPFALLSLAEHYIRSTKLKRVARTCLIAGDVTGNWNLYVDWLQRKRNIKEIIRKPAMLESIDGNPMSVEDHDSMNESIENKEIIEEGPEVTVVASEDIAVYPPTVDDIDKAEATGVKLRLSHDRVLIMLEEGVFAGEDAEDAADMIDNAPKGRYNPSKKRVEQMGVHTEGSWKFLEVMEICCDVKLDGKRKESALIYATGDSVVLGIIENPFLSKKNPLISAAVEPVSGSFFGMSKIEPVKKQQWALNDYWNMGQDSAQYALLPIIMTDPLANPNYNSMTMGLAAIWLTNPKSTEFVNFPPLWKDALSMCQAIKTQIWEDLDVNDAMLGKMPAGRKNNAMIGNMQQEAQINIIDHAKSFEDCILNPLIERMMELDKQFRTEKIAVETMGEVGYKAQVQQIEPQQWGITYNYRWVGTAYQMNMQRLQQMIAWVNVLRGIPPQQLNGLTLDVTPLLKFGTDYMFGPEVAPKLLVDNRNMFTIPADEENVMLHNGLKVVTHEADNDAQHIQSHQRVAMFTTDPQGLIREHIMAHQQQLEAKMQKQMAQQGGGQGLIGAPGGQVPGGGGAPGMAGTPQPGAQPVGPRQGAQAPPGAIRPDQMPGAEGRG